MVEERPIQKVLQRCARHARDRRDAPAFVENIPTGGPSRTLTFGALWREIQSLAGQIASRTQPGDAVLISYPNQLELVVAFFATLQAGRTAFPVNVGLTTGELLSALQRSGATLVIGTSETLDRVRISGVKGIDASIVVGGATDISQETVLLGNDPGLMLLSSGTTGTPKIVYRDARSLDAVAENVALATNLGPADRLLAIIALCHSYGVENGMLAPVFAGACVHLCQGFDPNIVVDSLVHSQITVFPAVPSIFEMLSLREDNPAFPKLRCAYSAGALLPRSVADRFAKNYGLPIGQLYGSTEVGSVTFNDPNHPSYDPSSVGLPMNHVDICIVDPQQQCVDEPLGVGVEGEVAVASPSMLSHYVGEPDPATHSGYFMTGDLGRLAASGVLSITGRLKLLIDVGAMKVNPLEVEQTLCEHPGVHECVVIPVPLTETISRLKAVVIAEPHGVPCDPEELRRFARERLSAHKIPRIIEFRTSVPRSPTGKILRRELV